MIDPSRMRSTRAALTAPRGGAIRTAACLALAAALATASGGSALGQGAGASDAAKQLELRRQQLKETEQRTKSVQQSVADLAKEREQINGELIESGRAIQRSEVRLGEIEARLGLLEVQERSVRGSLAERHDQISHMMAAMQRMGRNPPPVIITRREDALEMVRSAMMLARAFPELKQQAEELTGQLNELVRVMTAARTERENEKAESNRLQESRARLAGLLEVKRQTLAERNRELEDLRKTAAELNKDSANLTDVLARLDRTVAEKTGLGDYEAELKAREALQAPAGPGEPPSPPAPAAKGPEVAMVTPPPRPAVEIAPKADGASLNTGRLKPTIAFASARGRLPLPAVGRRVLSFGEKTQYGGQSKGIVLETRHSAQIVSPADGWVVYAGPFRSFGQLLIINPGSGYHILLAGMHQIDVQLGQFVLASEPVGTMAPAPKRASQDSAPVLYVEFRKDQKSIDPDPWWADSVQKVQG